MKTVKAPLTDGFLLTDIRPRTGSSFFRAKRKTKSAITLLTGAILVFSLLMTGLPSGGHKVLADSSKTRRSKMSSDLENAIVRSPNGTVRIILDTKPSSNSSAFNKLLAKIATMGGFVFRSINNGQSVSIQIRSSWLLALSSETAVKFMSLDRTTQVAGHLETTTGAAAARISVPRQSRFSCARHSALEVQ